MKAGQLITDGTVTWMIDDARDGARVGDIILRPTLRDGYIKANGATVKASEYPRLVAYVIAEHMTVTTEEYKTNCGKYVYDEAADTLGLPNVTGRVLQGGESVKSVEAGLPNLTGDIEAIDSSDGRLFKYKSLSNQGAGRGYGDGNHKMYSFDASRSNPIYGRSDTVQPPAITLIAQIKY